MLFEKVMQLFHSGLVSAIVHSNKPHCRILSLVVPPFRSPSQEISPATAQLLHRLEAIPSRALPEIIHFGQGPQVTLDTSKLMELAQMRIANWKGSAKQSVLYLLLTDYWCHWLVGALPRNDSSAKGWACPKRLGCIKPKQAAWLASSIITPL